MEEGGLAGMVGVTTSCELDAAERPKGAEAWTVHEFFFLKACLHVYLNMHSYIYIYIYIYVYIYNIGVAARRVALA